MSKKPSNAKKNNKYWLKSIYFSHTHPTVQPRQPFWHLCMKLSVTLCSILCLWCSGEFWQSFKVTFELCWERGYFWTSSVFLSYTGEIQLHSLVRWDFTIYSQNMSKSRHGAFRIWTEIGVSLHFLYKALVEIFFFIYPILMLFWVACDWRYPVYLRPI